MTSGASAVCIDGVSKSFGTVKVLRSTSLTIGSGEFFSLLGPSGCGKTTLLNIMGGLETPDEGRVLIGGEDVTRLPPERRPTNMVFQSYAIFPHLSVAKNIAYGLRSRKLGREETARKVNRMLDLVHLGGMGDRDPAVLSGGQRQRVALARALILEPKVLLLDESLAALDRRLREAMQIELRQLQRAVGITFVFVTHDQDEAMAMSDRIAVMGDGGILQVARPADLYHYPKNRAVAEFFGSINLLPIHSISETASGFELDAGPLGPLRLAACETAPPKASKWLALRPEAFEVRNVCPEDGANAFAGEVIDYVFLGDRSFVSVKLDSRAEPIIAAYPKGRSDLPPKRGDRVWLSWRCEEGQFLPET